MAMVPCLEGRHASARGCGLLAFSFGLILVGLPGCKSKLKSTRCRIALSHCPIRRVFSDWCECLKLSLKLGYTLLQLSLNNDQLSSAPGSRVFASVQEYPLGSLLGYPYLNSEKAASTRFSQLYAVWNQQRTPRTALLPFPFMPSNSEV